MKKFSFFTRLKQNQIFDSIYCFVKKIFDDDIFGLTAELTFYLTTSFFPFLILLLALISITPLSAEETLFKLLSNLPNEVYTIVVYMLTGVERSTIIIALSGILSFWSISGAVSTINKALNRMYRTKETRHFIFIRTIGFIFAILLAVLIILTFFLIIMGNVIGMAISRFFPSFNILWHVLRLGIAYVLLYISLSFIYKILPNKKLNFKSITIGALFTAVLWSASSVVFSFYVDNFSKYHIIYGGLAGIIVLISWLYMSSAMLLIGGEINAAIFLNKENKKTD